MKVTEWIPGGGHVELLYAEEDVTLTRFDTNKNAVGQVKVPAVLIRVLFRMMEAYRGNKTS